METKALKKQLGAAIAMVLVAAVALGSATYAWFVSNNTVTATSSTISAQSNSAYLVIDTKTTSTDSKTSKEITDVANEALYPAAIEKSDSSASWYSEYAAAAGAAGAKSGTKFTIGDVTQAVDKDYAIHETFFIGTGGYDGEFTDLKITGLSVKNAATDENKNLGNAMRVLVVCGNNWQVWSSAGEQLQSGSKGGEAIADSVKQNSDAQVEVYVYYDGSDDNVFSDNLEKIAADNVNGVTITFEATPKEYK